MQKLSDPRNEVESLLSISKKREALIAQSQSFMDMFLKKKKKSFMDMGCRLTSDLGGGMTLHVMRRRSFHCLSYVPFCS